MHNPQFSPFPAALGGPLPAQQRFMFKALTKQEHPINEKIKHNLLLNSSKQKAEVYIMGKYALCWIS